MRADYFRLCFIMKVGGFYVDADDIYQGLSVEELLVDGCLKLQPLCYEVATDSMVDPVSSAQSEGPTCQGWVRPVANSKSAV